METILEKVEDILFEPGDGLVDRLRDETGPMTEEEKEILLNFASDVNKRLIDNKADKKELYICLKILFVFEKYEEVENFVIAFYHNLIKNIEI